MTAKEIIEELRTLGNESYKNIYFKHGARKPYYGVKVEDLQKIRKRIKKNYEIALELFDSGISDAMYLAGLVADESKMTKDDLRHWAEKAYWYMLSEYPVAWVAAESPYGWELALEWIDSDKENIASSGWSTLSWIVAYKPDSEIDSNFLKALIDRAVETIHDSPNRVRYTMNGFLISVACYMPGLTDYAVAASAKTGKVKVNMGDTACKVPQLAEYLEKVKARGAYGKKRKNMRC